MYLTVAENAMTFAQISKTTSLPEAFQPVHHRSPPQVFPDQRNILLSRTTFPIRPISMS
jgi:hypothetical protein